VGLDPHECLIEMYEDRDVKNIIVVQDQVLDTVVLKQPLEEIAGWEC
jgi:hypothetical protein